MRQLSTSEQELQTLCIHPINEIIFLSQRHHLGSKTNETQRGAGKESTHPRPWQRGVEARIHEGSFGCWWWSKALLGAQGRGKEGRQLDLVEIQDPAQREGTQREGFLLEGERLGHQCSSQLGHILAPPPAGRIALGQLLIFFGLGFLICKTRILISMQRYVVQLRCTKDTLPGTLTFHRMRSLAWV